MATGKVFLTGAGPGNPGMLTLRGLEVLQSADLVLYDGLVNPLLLRLTDALCERTARTVTSTGTIVAQHEINDRLIAAALAGKKVVRLKGGDPYIFGRGSEEAAALEAAGIPYEVVPGITAATAAGEYAGFSFTHRNFSSAVAFITGHEDPTKETSRLNYAALAAFPGTLVFYMGLGRIESICSRLMQNGKPENTAAAVICKASLPDQQVVTASLGNLASVAAGAKLNPPSLIVIGECVRLRNACSWFERQPLFGLKIGVTRPAKQCDSVSRRITALAGQPVIMPLIEIKPVASAEQAIIDETLKQLSRFQWLVFTSVNGVAAFFDSLWSAGLDVRELSNARIAAIGSSTAAALADRSLRADVVPEDYRAEALAAALAAHVKNQYVLWPRASRGRDVLPQALGEAGADVTELVVYRNEDVTEFDSALIQQLTDCSLNWVGLSSPSIARQFSRLLDTHQIAAGSLTTKIAVISPVTAQAVREAGLNVAAEATTYTWDGILDAIRLAEKT